jgi:SNF2 family DNA or RNA helicase
VRDQVFFTSRHWSLVAADEAQRVKNDDTKVYEVIERLPRDRFIPMTGTPMENGLSDLWSIFNLAVPGLLGSARTFDRQFIGPIERDLDERALARLRQRLAPFMLYRDSRTYLDLPPLSERTVVVPVPPEYAQFYAMQRARLAARAREEGLVINAKTIALLTSALLAASHPAFDPTSGVTFESAPYSPKFAALLSRIRANHAQGRAILVFCRFTLVIDQLLPLLLAEGLRVAVIRGDSTDREGIVERFQACEYDVALLSTLAANAGITLTRATYVAHCSEWWTAAVRDQCNARAWRLTQTAPVDVEYLVLEGSADERVVAAQLRKERLFRAVFQGGSLQGMTSSREEVARLFGVVSETADPSFDEALSGDLMTSG